MAIATSKRCKACSSPHRNEIDKRLLKGDATRSVSAWLESSCGERIDFSSLANHKRSHLDVLTEVKERIEETRAQVRAENAAEHPAFEEAVQKALDSVAILDRLAAINLRVIEAHADLMADPNAFELDQGKVSVFGKCLTEARQVAVARHELLEGKKVNVDAIVAGAGVVVLPPEDPE